jgi:hypothetical protein
LSGEHADDLRDELGSEVSSTPAAQDYDKSAFAKLVGCPCNQSGDFDVAGRSKSNVSVLPDRAVITPVPE